MGGLGAVILGLFADLWGVPTTLWIIAFLPCGAFLMAVLIPYQSNARTSIPTNSV
jgi:predicted MFS family arabinose efflux permease